MTLTHRCRPSVVGCLLALGTTAGTTAFSAAGAPGSPFIVYYADSAPAEAFDGYELIVFDGADHPPIDGLQQRGKTVLGYISIGEIAAYRSGYRDVEAAGVLLSTNPNWPDSRLVDLRLPAWTRFLVDEHIPAILSHGFDGLFLDTLDNAAHLERLDSERFDGMTDAAIELVREIRMRYPDQLLMMNRAYQLLPEVDGLIDMVLGESVRADYDFETERYELVEQDHYREQVEILHAARARRPRLRVFTLDYWDPDDLEGVAAIYRTQRANGFQPYVATIELDRIVPEPGR